MTYAFNGTRPNLNLAVNRLNKSNFSILDSITGIISGNGSKATNAQVEAAVQWAVNKATNNYITYSQSNRHLKVVDAYSYDCSSFIITAFYAAGLDVNATYTGDMRAGFTSVGFKWIPGTSFESSQLQRGDILLNESLHTQMYIGDNRDVNCGSTPAKTMTHNTNNYGRGWDGILRYNG